MNADESAAPVVDRGSPKLLLVNGSLGGRDGNTAALLDLAARHLAPKTELFRIDLAERPGFGRHAASILEADAFLFATGTYWDSWGSPLQRFLEEATESEGTGAWLGKPAAALVTMHAVGGKGVLSRLLGVLNTLGCAIPPMGGLVVSLANQMALRAEENADLWRPSDLEIVCHNLLEAANGGRDHRAWPVDREGYPGRWLQT
jgi:chromate reductase